MVARKGQPNIVNDPGYKPDWRNRAKKTSSNKSLQVRLAFRTTGEFVTLLAKAANRRGMTSAGYARRAVAAFIAQDLQMPFEDVCAHFPHAGNFQFPPDGGGKRPRTWDDGQGYGNWEVKP